MLAQSCRQLAPGGFVGLDTGGEPSNKALSPMAQVLVLAAFCVPAAAVLGKLNAFLEENAAAAISSCKFEDNEIVFWINQVA